MATSKASSSNEGDYDVFKAKAATQVNQTEDAKGKRVLGVKDTLDSLF